MNWNCTGCNTQASSLKHFSKDKVLCPKCEALGYYPDPIDDVDLLIEKLFFTLTEYQKEGKNYGVYDSFRFDLNKKYTNSHDDTNVAMGISISVKNKPNLEASLTTWIHGGGTHGLPYRNVIYKSTDHVNIKTALYQFATTTLNELIEFSKSNDFYCCKCEKRFPLTGVAHQHFAGVYCKDCAEIHKKENSRKCGMCGVAIHSCCC